MTRLLRRIVRGAASAAALLAVFPGTAAADRALDEEILEKRHRRGDYGVFLAVHDPWDAQYDERDFGRSDAGTLAFPLGFKMRFRLTERLRLEGEASYYRRGEDVSPFVSTLAAPRFDGLMLAGTLQTFLRRSGVLRPYAGAGFQFVSLSRDFVVDLANAIPELGEISSPDRFQLGAWKESDVGVQGCLGLDVRLGTRAYPFFEYRHLFGELGIEEVRVGAFEFTPRELGAPAAYDFSGPFFILGLKVHF